MQSIDGRLIYSATDLNNYLECGHLVALERSVATGRAVRPEKRAAVDLIAQKGLDHERAYLETLQARFSGGVVEIDARTSDLTSIQRAVAATVEAMASGAPVIYQGTFFRRGVPGQVGLLVARRAPVRLLRVELRSR